MNWQIISGSGSGVARARTGQFARVCKGHAERCIIAKTVSAEISPCAADTPLVKKLNAYALLCPEDKERVNHFCRSVIRIQSGRDIVIPGSNAKTIFVITDGYAFRYKILSNGKRQILGYLIPGDLCDVYSFIKKRIDYSIKLLTDARVVTTSPADLWGLLWTSHALGQAFFRATLMDEGVLREHLVSLGRRSAYERLTHFICEYWTRMEQVELTSSGTAHFPFTQEQIGDLLGMTPVHVNRTLRILRSSGLVSLRSKTMIIYNFDRLKEISGFDASYLRIDEM